MATELSIPSRFAARVSVHVVMNFLDLPFLSPPLILGIHGPAGEGKTFQCHNVLRSMGMRIESIIAAELESASAGEPVVNLKKKYGAASRSNARALSSSTNGAEISLSAIVINDI